jgi:thioredoxin reductase (NADPH)
MPLHRFTLVTREACDLCEQMLAELERFCQGRALQITLADVDADAALRTRYGHRVPVLLLDDEPVCHGRFDPVEVERLLRRLPTAE